MHVGRSSKGTAGFLGVLFCGMVHVALSCAAQSGPSWMQDDLWDDGKAEFATYEVRWSRYGTTYPGRAVLVLVKEPWAPELEVKADTPRPEGFEVLKLQHVRDVPTGIYTYHQAASVFLRRTTGQLVKMTTSSAEACGITTSQWRDGTLTTSSYFDGQGDRRTAWPEGAWPWEALPAVLRGYVTGESEETVRIFAPLLTSRLPDLRAHDWSVTRRTGKTWQGTAGAFEAVEFELRHGDARMRYVFDAAFPHTLLHYGDESGTTYDLAKVERLAYWTQHDPGGEEWYPPDLRDGYTP